MTPHEKLAAAKDAFRTSGSAEARDRALYRTHGVDVYALREHVVVLESRPADPNVTRRPAPGCPACKGTGRIGNPMTVSSDDTHCACVRPIVESR